MMLTLAGIVLLGAGCAGKNTAITVISREDGSGTRSVFTELLGIASNGVDGTTDYAEVSNSTAVVLQSVADNRNSIGYISLGSMSDLVKAVQVDGFAPTAENLRAGSYRLARPFIMVRPGATDWSNPLAEDFMAFILSEDGQRVVEDKGYIKVAGENPYVPAGLEGTLVVAGSTSVAPVMEALADRYRELNPAVIIQIQQTGSSAGIASTLEGASHIGMTSRDLSQKELEQGLVPVVLALDGIALVVNRQNGVDNLSVAQIKDIYTGTVQDWQEIQEDWRP
ncbi:MAG: substrate-binding domain-containing protein [Spirochaetaceae bacterium]|nr:substrate-binding domain-containing protein [Spirochaetaceae bacterium]